MCSAAENREEVRGDRLAAVVLGNLSVIDLEPTIVVKPYRGVLFPDCAGRPWAAPGFPRAPYGSLGSHPAASWRARFVRVPLHN